MQDFASNMSESRSQLHEQLALAPLTPFQLTPMTLKRFLYKQLTDMEEVQAS
jgi:hypothetical protein